MSPGQTLEDDQFIIPPDMGHYSDSDPIWISIADTEVYLEWTTDEPEVDLYLLSTTRFEFITGIGLSIYPIQY